MTASFTDHHGAHRVTLAALGYAMVAVLSGGVPADPAFMRYDATARVVELTVTAGYDRSNSGFNMNGGSYGSHRITVPAGWQVKIAFTNADVIPHSVALVREEMRIPARIEKPAFAGASSRAIVSGLPAGARQNDIAFVADRPGAYLLACGVPGHAAVGSYMRFTVSKDAAVPTYETGVVSRRTVREP